MKKIIFTDADRDRLSNYPNEIPLSDVISYFTLTESDKSNVYLRKGAHNHFGFALQLGVLRYLGFCPNDLLNPPKIVSDYLLRQLEYKNSEFLLKMYGERDQTRTQHFQIVQRHLGFSRASVAYIEKLSSWLLERALEHDKPTLLFNMMCEKLFSEKIVRPGIVILEEMVITARKRAQTRTYQLLNFLLTDERKSFLDKILLLDESLGHTPLFWLRKGEVSNNPKAILNTIKKLNFLKDEEVEKWDLNCINPNRRKFLAQLGKRSTNQDLQRTPVERRYPILLSFLFQCFQDIIDELIDLFIRCLGDCEKRAKNDLKEFQLSIAKSTNEKLIMFKNMAKICLDKTIPDSDIRKNIFHTVPKDVLKVVLNECSELIRPKDDKAWDYFGNRFSYIREFSPKFLSSFDFHSIDEYDSLLRAIDVINKMNREGKRKIPKDAPVDFIAKSWNPYVQDAEGNISRRYYEISTLWELRKGLLSGDIWVENSRRYANIESYLIPKDKWESFRTEACQLLGLPENAEERLLLLNDELEQSLEKLDNKVSQKDGVRIEDGKIVLTPYKSEDLPETVIKLQDLISKMLPRVELVELLIEVDSWTNFTECFEYSGTKKLRTKDLLKPLYASIVAQACNFGLAKMADISNGCGSFETTDFC